MHGIVHLAARAGGVVQPPDRADIQEGGPAGADEVDDSFIPRATVGVSVFWNTPIGPLRFNFSHALKKEDYDKEQTFDLTVSTKF